MSASARVEQHDVDVGLEAQLGPPVAADGDERRPRRHRTRPRPPTSELRQPAVDEVAVGPARALDPRGCDRLRGPLVPAPEPCPSLTGGYKAPTSAPGGDVDRIPGAGERRRVGEVEVDQLVDPHAGVRAVASVSIRLADRSSPTIWPPSRRPRASLADQLDRHRLGVRHVAGDRRGVDGRRRGLEPVGAPPRARSGRCDAISRSQTLVMAVPTTPGKVA